MKWHTNFLRLSREGLAFCLNCLQVVALLLSVIAQPRLTILGDILRVASSGGTILGVIQKYDASADAAVALSGNVDLEALTAHEGTAVTFLSTLTEAQKTMDAGDTIRFAVTASSTVGTAAVDLTVNVELLVLE